MKNQRTRGNIPRLTVAAIVFALLASVLEYWPTSTEIQWRTYEAALAESKQTGKLVYLDLYATWCGPCKKMDAETFPNDTVRALFTDKYIPARIDVDTDQYTDSLRTAWNLRGIPTGMILKPDGQEVKRVVGFQSSTVLIRWLDGPGARMFSHWLPFDEARQQALVHRRPMLALVSVLRQNENAMETIVSDSSFQAYLQTQFTPTFLAGYDQSAPWIDSLRGITPLANPSGGVVLVVLSPDMRIHGQIVVTPWESDDLEVIRGKLESIRLSIR